MELSHDCPGVPPGLPELTPPLVAEGVYAGAPDVPGTWLGRSEPAASAVPELDAAGLGSNGSAANWERWPKNLLFVTAITLSL
jgi:hypothetical protein